MAGRLRVALMLRRFAPADGGLESWAHDLALALLDRGHEVVVLATDAPVRPPGLGVRLVPTADDPLDQARLFAAAARDLPGFLSHDTGIALGADLHQPQMGCRALLARRMMAAHRLRHRLRLALSGWHRRHRAGTLALERAQLAAARRVAAVSRETAAAFRRMGVPEERLMLLPNGIDTARFHPDRLAPRRAAERARLGLRDGQFALLMAANNFRLKGVQHAIAALARLPALDALLLVAGDGEVAAFEALARRAGVAGRVRFLGPVREMDGLFAAADAFVHPTAHDACSLATLEALAAGLAVVTTRQNGAADGITDGLDGIVLPGPAAAPLAAALERLADPLRRAAMGAAAHRMAQRHAFARQVDDILAAYRALSVPAGA